MSVLVWGDRNWNHNDKVYSYLDQMLKEKRISLLIHGGCRGVDTIAGAWGFERKYQSKFSKRNGINVEDLLEIVRC